MRCQKGISASAAAKDEYYIGEFERLLCSMRKINHGLSALLLQISQSADSVAAGSEQVSSSSQNLAQEPTEQAASVEELTGMMTEISDQAYRNSRIRRRPVKNSDGQRQCGRKQPLYAGDAACNGRDQ